MKIIFFLFFSSIVLLALVSNSQSATYTTIQPPDHLTDDNIRNKNNFSINNNNYIVWCEDDKILLYDGASIVQVADNAGSNPDLQINSSGHFVWNGSNDEIFFYDGSNIIQINDIGTHGFEPNINNSDNVVWYEYDSGSKIFIYDGSSTTELNFTGENLQINNNGQIVSQQGCEVYLYDGSEVIQLSNDSNWNSNPQINDNGYVVWEEFVGQDIYLYDGFSTIQLTDNKLVEFDPQINNDGCAVWMGKVVGEMVEEVFSYDGLEIIQITNDKKNKNWLQINNNGYIVWSVDHGTDWEIYLYDGNNTYQVTDNYVDDILPQISDDGLLVWLGGSFDNSIGEIYYTHIQSGDGSIENDIGPSLPNLIQPAHNSEVTTLTPTLVADIPPNALENSSTYEFQLDVKIAFDTTQAIVSPDIVVAQDRTATWQPGTLDDNTLYYWRVRAPNGMTQSVWTVSSFFVNLENDAPSPPYTIDRDLRSVSSLDRDFYLNVTPAIDKDQDELTYSFELYQDSSLWTLLCSVDSESTSWMIPIPLQFDTYYYRVRATDEHGLQGPWSSTTELVITEREKTPFIDLSGFELDLEGYNPLGSAGGCFITNLF